jgi:hypothetical protein
MIEAYRFTAVGTRLWSHSSGIGEGETESIGRKDFVLAATAHARNELHVTKKCEGVAQAQNYQLNSCL